MRILQVNKYHYYRGGAERYYFEISRLLERAGHEVIHFSMAGDRNEPSPWSEYFVPETDFRCPAGALRRARDAAHTVWNPEAYERIGRLVKRVRPDVAHLHNIAHQLSGSIVVALRRRGVPTVHSLHDYKLVCPAYRRFRDGRPCDDCRRRRFWNAVRHRCVLDSRAASLVAAVETSLYSAFGLYTRGIDLFHSPSLFVKRTIEDWGFPEERIFAFPLTIDLTPYVPADRDEGYFLYLGRLSHEKGLPVLVDAAARFPEAEIRVAGEGPEKPALEGRIAERGVRSIRFLGYLGGEALREQIAGCRAVLLPSEYDDNSPVVIYESFALGKPILGAERGGIPEMVRPDETGLLFPAGDGAALAAGMRRLAGDPPLARRLGRAARERMETEYGAEKHLERLLALYEAAIKRHG
ncbi:MAG: glycosyltransferase [Candidatus Eisenbacteria bacterium]|nr:glycosyltransferase [Candidatus Eisenbacteria bacterium]